MYDRPTYGLNRRELDRILVSVGGSVEDVHKTGEIRYRHPQMKSCPKADKRRKDAPMHMVKFVRAIMDRLDRPMNAPGEAA